MRWNVNGHHFLSTAFHHSPGNGEFDMNSLCPALRLGSPPRALCVSGFHQPFFSAALFFFQLWKCGRLMDRKSICVYGGFMCLCALTCIVVQLFPPKARGKVFVKALHLKSVSQVTRVQNTALWSGRSNNSSFEMKGFCWNANEM